MEYTRAEMLSLIVELEARVEELETKEIRRIKDTEQEWGIAYHDNPQGYPVDPIRNPAAARGIFGHYGVPGDKLVRREVGPWITVEEK